MEGVGEEDATQVSENENDVVETNISAQEQVDLDFEYALARAAILLDHAGDIAVQRQDIDSILKISSGWLTLSNMLSSNDESEEDEEVTKGTIGFVSGGGNGTG